MKGEQILPTRLSLKEAENSHGKAGKQRILGEDALVFADRLEIAHIPDRADYYRGKAIEFFQKAEKLRTDGELDIEGSPQ